MSTLHTHAGIDVDVLSLTELKMLASEAAETASLLVDEALSSNKFAILLLWNRAINESEQTHGIRLYRCAWSTFAAQRGLATLTMVGLGG